MLRRAAAVLTALLAVLALPAAASAVTLKGTVVGSPYVGSQTRTAIPVLFSKQTAKAAGLTSPLGLLVVPRKGTVTTPDGAVRPGNLRLGDKFKLNVRVAKSVQKAVYPRLELKRLKAISVTKRSKTLSNDELTAALKKTQLDLKNLKGYVGALQAYTVGQLTDVRTITDALRRDLNLLRADFSALNASMSGLSASLAATRKDLQTQIDGLNGDVGGLKASLQGVLDRLTTLEANTARLRSDLDALTASVAGIQNGLRSLTDLVGLQGARLTSLETAVSQLQELIAALDPTAAGQTLTTLSSLQSQITTLGGTLTTATGTITSLVGRVTTVEGTLGTLGSSVTGLTSTVGTLVTDLSGLTGTVSTLTGNQATLSSTVTTVQGQIATVTSGLSTANGAITTLQSMTSGLTTQIAAIDSVLTPLNALVTAPGGIKDDVAGLCGFTVTVGLVSVPLAPACP